jgi:hypothetical protein
LENENVLINVREYQIDPASERKPQSSGAVEKPEGTDF